MEYKKPHFLFFTISLLFFLISTASCRKTVSNDSCSSSDLRFGEKNGRFKILQIADMHYGEGKTTPCEDVYEPEYCSDLNTTAFIYRVVKAEKPDLVVFAGDNIFGYSTNNSAKSMDMAFAPVIDLKVPWAAIVGNHDQEGSLDREHVMKYIVGMNYTLSKYNPDGVKIDGFGNYNLEVKGAKGSSLAKKSVLNLYMLDSGDDCHLSYVGGYDWIKVTQQTWFNKTSSRLQKEYTGEPEAQPNPAPGLVFFHIPLPEFGMFKPYMYMHLMSGEKQEGISSADVNPGFYQTMLLAGDVKAVFVGHDHKNDYCVELNNITMCYAGGFGYHAYGQLGWPRRARVISASLEKKDDGTWGGVKSIRTWKRLDDEHLSTIDSHDLWVNNPV